MNLPFDQLTKSILQVDTLEQCSIQELQRLVDQYPYFGAAQLLLAKKIYSENVEQGNSHLQKTSLFFYNPLWLEHLINNTGNAEIIPSVSLIAEEEKEQSTVYEMKSDPVLMQEKGEMTIEQTEIKSEYEEQTIEDHSEIPIELPAFKIEPFDPAKAELIPEPYYMVDYFASQGIKFKEEALPQDKFGKQLKSFTEWLKTLKKLPESAITQTTETNIEQKVEQLADQSLQDREVITEAMADVWKKQGNPDRAIEIYNKLSLLDASKRPYFAAKIEELKKIN